MGVSINGGTPKWMVYKGNPIEMDDLGVPPFMETPKSTPWSLHFKTPFEWSDITISWKSWAQIDQRVTSGHFPNRSVEQQPENGGKFCDDALVETKAGGVERVEIRGKKMGPSGEASGYDWLSTMLFQNGSHHLFRLGPSIPKPWRTVSHNQMVPAAISKPDRHWPVKNDRNGCFMMEFHSKHTLW